MHAVASPASTATCIPSRIRSALAIIRPPSISVRSRPPRRRSPCPAASFDPGPFALERPPEPAEHLGERDRARVTDDVDARRKERSDDEVFLSFVPLDPAQRQAVAFELGREADLRIAIL